jgi:chromate transport protein ChrA
MIILVGGLFLANLAGNAVRGTGTANSGFLAMVARSAVMVLTAAMALREMGFAEDIVNLAFGLLFGAVAVAVALAFGLGGRDAAGAQVQSWRDKMEKKDF